MPVLLYLEHMERRPYRVEANYPEGRPPQYFLVKDVGFKDKKSKVKKYLGNTPPSEKDIEKLSIEHTLEIETRAAEKKAEFSSAFYTPDYFSTDKVREIEELRFLYRTFTGLLTTNEIEAYEQKFEVYYVQGTTSIEGNTFSVRETHDLLINGILPKEKSLREINEIQNFKKVQTFRNKYKGKVTPDFIRTLHSFIMNNIDYESAGVFRRTDDIGIVGCDLRVTPSIMIEDEIEESIEEYYTSIKNGKYPFEQAVLFHYRFEMIHPFADGNGRVGREVFNYLLQKEGYPKLLFLGKDRNDYISALKMGNDGNYSEMISLFAELIMRQRSEIIKENLKKVVIPPKRKQMRLTDFGLDEL